uniref:Recep_L_domain domain-containing protein n=1 Tax=Ascaris lumbricoides TaxID=6252 RepID=A0A0M3I949_ASCLU
LNIIQIIENKIITTFQEDVRFLIRTNPCGQISINESIEVIHPIGFTILAIRTLVSLVNDNSLVYFSDCEVLVKLNHSMW